ncbi:disulfide bond formation protein B [Yoonia sp. 208BN28-4]|uniref:disulfide bond formation protein B n=1 Tax=Yoonia sp. 208BN28-4 TaxID=3126505 RepID=UPI003094B2AB
MTCKTYTILAAGGSAALLIGAYLFQFAGYPPCQMCYWQRWPHFAAVAIGAIALYFGAKALTWLGALAAATTSGIGIYHTGVERGWWEGPTSCTGGGDLLSGDLLSTDGPRLVMCDQVSWEFLTLSMASWNAIFSAVLMVLWIKAALSAR